MQKKMISIFLCIVMLFTVYVAGMTASATHYPSPGIVSGYTMGDTLTVNGIKYECTSWWATTEPPGISWKEIGPDDTSGDKNQNTAQKSITINVLPTDDKIYMGYGTLKDVLLDLNGNKLRNYIPCDKVVLKEGEPIILYMTAQIPGKWYLGTYDDCVLLELTSNGLEVTGASYDWRGITKKETCNYKVNVKSNYDGTPRSADIRYGEQIIFDWTSNTNLQCKTYVPIFSLATFWKDADDITFSSSNSNVISINKQSFLWAKHPGKTTITAASSDGITQSIDLTVNVDLTMKVGEEIVLIGVDPTEYTGTTGYMEHPTKIQYLTNNSGSYTSMAPVRFIGEYIGYQVDYSEETKDIKLTDNFDGHYICMRLDESTITSYHADGSLIASFQLPVPVTLIDGSTYAPLRTISEYSGLHCQFISDTEGDFIVLDDYAEPLTDNAYEERIYMYQSMHFFI